LCARKATPSRLFLASHAVGRVGVRKDCGTESQSTVPPGQGLGWGEDRAGRPSRIKTTRFLKASDRCMFLRRWRIAVTGCAVRPPHSAVALTYRRRLLHPACSSADALQAASIRLYRLPRWLIGGTFREVGAVLRILPVYFRLLHGCLQPATPKPDPTHHRVVASWHEAD
jgi:hypothetical protein